MKNVRGHSIVSAIHNSYGGTQANERTNRRQPSPNDASVILCDRLAERERNLCERVAKIQIHVFMNKVTRERNQQIIRQFDQLYGSMPTMLIYAHLANEHELSEASIRAIVKQRNYC